MKSAVIFKNISNAFNDLKKMMLKNDFIFRSYHYRIMIFFLPISLFAQNWHSIEPRVTDETLFSISFCDSMHGWAVGENGIVLHSNDGGSRWELQQSGVTDTLLDVSFGDSLNGMAVGKKNTVIKTVDGGKTWQKLEQKSDSFAYNAPNFSQVNCFGKDTCWIIKKYWFFLSIDGGKTIRGPVFASKESVLVFMQIPGEIVEVYFKNSYSFWVLCSDGTSFRTSNGGITFDTLQKPVFPTNRIFSICNILFINDSIGWIANAPGYLVSTNNGGTSWQNLTIVDSTCSSGNPCFLMTGFHFTTPLSGVVLASYPKRVLYKTSDGGLNWALDPTFPGASELLQKLYYDKQENGWTVGEFGAIYTNKKTKPALARNRICAMQRNICEVHLNGSKLIIKSTGDNGYVSLFDLTGKTVIARTPVDGIAGQSMTVSVAITGLAIGNYLCKISGKNGTIFTRIIQKTR
jgi:photosystem II stability/assembly factor-like uncharacterized protein